MKVYILEDNLDYRIFLHKVFDSEGHTTASFHSGKELIDKLKNYSGHQPVLIISDLMMPEMDGHTFLKKINKLENKHLFKSLVLSSKKSQKDIDRAFKNGCDNYIIKGTSKDIILEEANRLFDHEDLNHGQKIVLLQASEVNPYFDLEIIDDKYIIKTTIEYPVDSILRVNDKNGNEHVLRALDVQKAGLSYKILCGEV